MIINQEKWNFLLFYFDYYIEKLEQDVIVGYSLPVTDLIG